MASISRRTFFKLSALAATALVATRYAVYQAGAQAQQAARAVICLVMPGMDVPTLVPTVIGDDCQPFPTSEPSHTPTPTPLVITLSPTLTATGTATRTPTASPSSSPTMTADIPTATPAPRRRTWLPWVAR